MSKKKAVNFSLSYLHYRSRPEYLKLDFIDKRGREMMSSVQIVLNAEYFDENDINGYVRAR